MTRYAALAAALVLMSGCGDTVAKEAGNEVHDLSGGGSVLVWHDDERMVTCWAYASVKAGGIHCIPDHLLKPQTEKKESQP